VSILAACTRFCYLEGHGSQQKIGKWP
jgi:hypothetical protein